MSWAATTFGEGPSPESCTPAGCAEGHDPSDAIELCSQCLPDFARFAQDQRCQACPDGDMTNFFFFLAVLLATALFSALVWDNLHGAMDMIPEEAARPWKSILKALPGNPPRRSRAGWAPLRVAVPLCDCRRSRSTNTCLSNPHRDVQRTRAYFRLGRTALGRTAAGAMIFDIMQ